MQIEPMQPASKPKDRAEMVEHNLGRRHYCVEMRGRTYRAVHDVIRKHWQVETSRGVGLNEYGDTARRVIQLCEAAFSQTEDEFA